MEAEEVRVASDGWRVERWMGWSGASEVSTRQRVGARTHSHHGQADDGEIVIDVVLRAAAEPGRQARAVVDDVADRDQLGVVGLLNGPQYAVCLEHLHQIHDGARAVAVEAAGLGCGKADGCE